MELFYSSTRDGRVKATASQAILQGLSGDGGLFVPSRIPKLQNTIEELARMSYQEVAWAVMREYLTDFTEEELKDCIGRAYDSKFDTQEIAPLVKADGMYYLELFHGKTVAFKDMALSILPYLLLVSAKKNRTKDDIVILTATSGDTGKAALAGFADVEGTRIIVFYPKDGVSPIQEKQMVTQRGDNVMVVGVEGNFDDCQTGVKKIFSDRELSQRMSRAGLRFSSANSINIGRLVPQIVYYVYAYAKLYQNGVIAADERINVTVPTGNFGNILAAYYAKNMGLPIGKLICASNENRVLYDFFKDGVYDKNREFILTSSPSMDILISSNLERLIYRIAGDDAGETARLMEALNSGGRYEISPQMAERLKDFEGGYSSEQETSQEIRGLYQRTGYVIDTHTAVASSVCRKQKAAQRKAAGESQEGKAAEAQEALSLVVSTASPYKFTRSVMSAIDPKYDTMDDFDLVDELCRLSNVEVPQAIREIKNAPVIHKKTCAVGDMQGTVQEYLGVN